jgi:serine/threonine-protein kinase
MVSSLSGEVDFLKVLDFGIARQLDSDEKSLTLIGMVVGTPAFMAPETLAGARGDPLSDVWSFGATLYTMLTATLPFDHSALADRAATRAPLQPPSERLGAPPPPELDDFVMRCMSWDPRQRFPDGQAMLEALQRVPGTPWSREDALAWWGERALTASDTSTASMADIAPTVPDAVRR